MKGIFDSIIYDSRPVIVDVRSSWFNPCKIHSPILKDVATEMGEKIRIIKIDVDQNSEIARQYNIQSVPTIILFQTVKQVWRHSGVVCINHLLSVLIKNIP
jgi:thioredoxin 1